MTDRTGQDARADILIVLGSDDRYALPLAVTLYSGLRRIPDSVRVDALIFDAGITPQNRTRIERVGRLAHANLDIAWVSPDMDQFAGLRTTHWGSPASYLPLLIPQIVEGDRQVLYLDSDLLIEGNLNELWQLGAEDHRPVHAVRDYGFPTVGSALKGDAAIRLGIDGDAPYFNSGVLLIDLPAWRSAKIADRALDFARDHPDVMRFTDQDALNAVIQGDWAQLDPRWNVLVGSIDLMAERLGGSDAERAQHKESLTKTPNILHFSGQQKPWKAGYSRLGRGKYLRTVHESGWFDSQTDYWSWRLKLTMLSPMVKARRQIVKLTWPIVVRIREQRSPAKVSASQ